MFRSPPSLGAWDRRDDVAPSALAGRSLHVWISLVEVKDAGLPSRHSI